MKGISVLTTVNALIWGLLIVMGRSGIASITAQHVVGFPNSGQITYYLYIPIVAVCVALAGYAISRGGRFKGLVLFVESAILLALFPYMLGYTGGI